MNGVCSAQNIFVCKKHQPAQNTSNERKLIQQHKGVLRLQKLLGLVRAELKAPLWGLPLPNDTGVCTEPCMGVVSPTWWTGVWAGCGNWWRTGKPGMQKVGHDWATEWTDRTVECLDASTGSVIWHVQIPWLGVLLTLTLYSWEQETDQFNTVPGLVSLCLFFISGSVSSGQESGKSHVIQNTPNKQKQGFQVHPLDQKISVDHTKGCMAGPITSVGL